MMNSIGASNSAQFFPVEIFKSLNSASNYISLKETTGGKFIYTEFYYVNDTTVNISYNELGLQLYGVK